MTGLRIAKFVVLLGIPFVILYWFLYLDLISRSPLSNDQMDLNNDGSISFAEADYAGNFETRKVTRDGQVCTEYLALKDYKTLKVECEQ